jgi:hypothetical protein
MVFLQIMLRLPLVRSFLLARRYDQNMALCEVDLGYGLARKRDQPAGASVAGIEL